MQEEEEEEVEKPDVDIPSNSESRLTPAGKRSVSEECISKVKRRKVKINRPALASSNDTTSRLAANQFFNQNELASTVRIDY
jgi:hypothetical protein